MGGRHERPAGRGSYSQRPRGRGAVRLIVQTWGVMRVLVAGDRGYIGTVLMPFLCAAGHEADGLDLGLYEGCDLGPALPHGGSRATLDMRDATPAELAGYDAV